MKLKIIDILNIEAAITDLELNEERLPFNIAFVLNKNMNKCLEVTDFFFKRLEKIIGADELKNIESLTEENKLLYNTLLLTEVDIDLKIIDVKEILKSNNIYSKILSIKHLEPILFSD